MVKPPPFDVQIEQDPTGISVRVRGDIDIATIRSLEDARERVLAKAPRSVLIDLRAVGFVDSSGLKFLLETLARSQQEGWTLQILRPAETAMKVFMITGADKHLPFVDAGER
jgi:anti-anti-sigma factor